jgi:hypothetical protein
MVQLWDLYLKQERICALTGLPIKLGTVNEISASLDRIDSTRGYTLDNVQWVHKDINRMKGDLTPERFLELCQLVAAKNHQP